MILTRDRILAELRAGNIVIDPFDETAVSPASVDLHLGDQLRVFDGALTPIEVEEDTDVRDFSHLERLDGHYSLETGTTVLGITRERIRLAPDICGRLEGRSRFARLGLMVHVTAGFVNPGIDNRQVLEISNVSGRTLLIAAGTRICQMIFERAEGAATYTGRFSDQNEL